MQTTLIRAFSIAVVVLASANLQAQGMSKMSMPKAEYGASAAFTDDGMLLAVTKQGEHVLLYRSRDEGNTWLPPTVVNASPEPISADGENRPKVVPMPDGRILVSWTRPLGKPFSGEVRLAHSDDGGITFSAPLTVHQDRAEITHRFETPLVARDGRVYIAWIDKRDLEAAKLAKKPYRGAAIYLAVSEDGGKSFLPEIKVADHSCECCRIVAALDTDGAPVFMWRHVFEPNIRDHALARIAPDGKPLNMDRATFDGWRVDACPHHGPSLAIAPDGTRHAVWFNVKDGAGRVFYGRLRPGGVEGQRTVGGERAAHADLAVSNERIAIVWKEFDGERTRLYAEISVDGGNTFKKLMLATAEKNSDQPRALVRGDELFAFWRTEVEGMRVFPLR
ncbi:MAG: sialidase family protein [Thiobacillus sp.]